MTAYVEVLPTTFFPVHPLPVAGVRGGYPTSGRPEGATSSSWPVKSITYTSFSDIAKGTLISLLSLPETDPRRKNDYVCSEFTKYLIDCEQKGFMIKGYDTKKKKIINLPLSYNNRWGPVRRRILSDKLDRVEFWFNANSDRAITMITLTGYHPDNISVSDAWQKLNDSRSKLLKLIRKYCGSPDYFWVVEPHPEKDAGYVHYHLIVFANIANDFEWWTQHHGIEWYRGNVNLEDKFREIWSKKYKTGSHTFGLDFIQKAGEDEIKSLKNYLIKYLRPGHLLGNWSIGTLIFNAHLWDNKFRLYGASKNISHIINIEDESDNDVVWLETRLQTIELTPENDEIEIDKVIWYRLYIPDWIDSPMWLGEKGEILGTDPPPQYLYDWGRPCRSPTYAEPILYDPIAARRARNKDTGW